MARFNLGRVVATPAALERAAEHDVDLLQLLGRHLIGDWGDTCAQDNGRQRRLYTWP